MYLGVNLSREGGGGNVEGEGIGKGWAGNGSNFLLRPPTPVTFPNLECSGV